MADESTAIEQISFLTRSEPRVRILTHLLEAEPTSQREFRSAVETSRSTVTRALSALEEQDWIVQNGDRYRLTPSGRLIAEGLTDLVDTVQATDDLSTFIRWFPLADYDVDIDQLREAEVTASTDPDPYAPSRKHAAALRDATSFRMLLPSIDLQLVESTDTRVRGGDLELELVVSPEVEATIQSGEFADVLRGQIASGNLTVLVTDDPVPFYVGLSGDGDVQIGVEDDQGFPRALLETDDEVLRTWAGSVYDEHRAAARRKPAAEF
jgi:predicted transcriptional regulator